MGRKAMATNETVKAAMIELRERGVEATVENVRGITGGDNVRIRELIEACTAELAAHESVLKTLSPSISSLGTQLFEQAVMRILGEVDREASLRVQHAREDAVRQIEQAKRSEMAALAIADRAEAALEVLQEQLDVLKSSAAIAEGKAAQRAEELSRLADALRAAQAEQRRATDEAAQLRGQLESLRQQAEDARKVDVNALARIEVLQQKLKGSTSGKAAGR